MSKRKSIPDKKIFENETQKEEASQPPEDKNIQKQHWTNTEFKKGISEGFHSIWFNVRSTQGIQDNLQGWTDKVQIRQGCRIGFSTSSNLTFPFGSSEASQSVGLDGLIYHNQNAVGDYIDYMYKYQIKNEENIGINEFIRRIRETNGMFFWKTNDKIILNIQLNADHLEHNQCLLRLQRDKNMINLSDQLFMGQLNHFQQNVGQSILGKFDFELVKSLKECFKISHSDVNKLIEKSSVGQAKNAQLQYENQF